MYLEKKYCAVGRNSRLGLTSRHGPVDGPYTPHWCRSTADIGMYIQYLYSYTFGVRWAPTLGRLWAHWACLTVDNEKSKKSEKSKNNCQKI